VGIPNISADNLQLIVPNLHRRYSGVTATNRMVAPKLAKMFRAAWLGPDAPDGIARMGVADLAKLWRRRNPLIWHARRNNEMITGVLLRSLGWPLKLVFTSAAQRHHTWITRWLIRRMDAIIATNDISASFLKREATVIPHGVDTDTYAPPADRAAAFAEAKLPGRYAIGCFGRVRAQKGSDVFVDAMCRLLPRYPDFSAVMVGAITPEQSGFANDLKKRIEAASLQSRIVITGELEIEEVQRWYRRLTVYAFTSRNEGFGLTLIEAMSVGAALVAVARGRGRACGRGWRDRCADAAGRRRRAGCRIGTFDARSGCSRRHGRAGARAGAGEIQSRYGSCQNRRCLPQCIIGNWLKQSRRFRNKSVRAAFPSYSNLTIFRIARASVAFWTDSRC